MPCHQAKLQNIHISGRDFLMLYVAVITLWSRSSCYSAKFGAKYQSIIQSINQ